ncbi:MAG: diguanylate cyclase [Deltaproteobacteria bacterium]|nr:MAG: diguanylate cyclase [Deltaproteobacteria bacterium]
MAPRILLIDDDRFARQVYGDALREAGYEVETAADGEAGLEALSRAQGTAGHVDVVILDMLLPGMDGHAVLSEARRIDPDVGVVVISALDRVDSAVRAIKAGAFDYLLKPVNSETLRIVVQRCLELRELLRENEGLKAHLALSQAGARITSDTERGQVYRHLVDALLGHTRAHRVLVVAEEEDRPVTLADAGEGPPAEALLPSPVVLQTVAGSPGFHEISLHEGHAVASALPEVESPTAVLLVSQSPLGETDLGRASFLLRHAAQALAALRRLEAAQELAYEDDLTGLYNARYLDRALDEALERAHSMGVPFSVLFLDLDHFKAVNDRYGHLAGSHLLAEVARVLKACIREDDKAVRYGGDEYVVLLPETRADAALRIAERIRQQVASHRFVLPNGEEVAVTVSIGVAAHPEHALNKEGILDQADAALYRGKRSRRNVVFLAGGEDAAQA